MTFIDGQLSTASEALYAWYVQVLCTVPVAVTPMTARPRTSYEMAEKLRYMREVYDPYMERHRLRWN